MKNFQKPAGAVIYPQNKVEQAIRFNKTKQLFLYYPSYKNRKYDYEERDASVHREQEKVP